MPKTTTTTTAEKRGPGRPRKDPTGISARRSVRLTPTQEAHLERHYGSLSGGIAALVDRDISEKSSAKNP